MPEVENLVCSEFSDVVLAFKLLSWGSYWQLGTSFSSEQLCISGFCHLFNFLSDLLWILECECTQKPVSQIHSMMAFKFVYGRSGLQILSITVNELKT